MFDGIKRKLAIATMRKIFRTDLTDLRKAPINIQVTVAREIVAEIQEANTWVNEPNSHEKMRNALRNATNRRHEALSCGQAFGRQPMYATAALIGSFYSAVLVGDDVLAQEVTDTLVNWAEPLLLAPSITAEIGNPATVEQVRQAEEARRKAELTRHAEAELLENRKPLARLDRLPPSLEPPHQSAGIQGAAPSGRVAVKAPFPSADEIGQKLEAFKLIKPRVALN